MANNQIPNIYKAAIERYEEITRKKLDDPSLLKLTSVEGLIQTIESDNAKFESFRAKRHGIFAALASAMRPIELLGDLAAGAAEMAFEPSALVFGAISLLIHAAKDVSASYDAILDVMEMLKDFTIRLEVYTREQVSKSMSDKLANILVVLIDILALSREEIKGGRVRRYAKNLIAGENKRLQDAVSKLKQFTESEDLLVGAETLTAVKRSERTLEGVSQTVQELTQSFNAFRVSTVESLEENREDQGTNQQDQVRIALQPTTSALDWYDRLNRSRVSDTGNWIREEPIFKSWLEKEFPILWVTGIPGAGKSYIASNIINYLKEQCQQHADEHSPDMSVGFFFLKDDNPDTQTFTQALRDIAYQLSRKDTAYEKYIASVCGPDSRFASLQSIWRNLFVDYFLQNSSVNCTVYIVLDGMDESYPDSREQFLELMKDIKSETGRGGVQLVMLGRPHLIEEFELVAEMEQVPTIHVTEGHNSEDIMHYIENSIKKSALLRRAPKALQSEIVQKLTSGAGGMFIWVDFMLKELVQIMRTPNVGRVRESLNRAPRGLNTMIRHVLEGFSLHLKDNPEGADDLNAMLTWITCAKRPLKLEELDALLKINSPTGDGNWWLERTLRVQFASIFMLAREDGLTTAELQRVTADAVDDETIFDSHPATTTVSFCHASIGDFFRNESEVKGVSAENCPAIGLDYHEAQISVLKTCLAVLCTEPSSELWDRAANLLPYIGTYWIPSMSSVDISRVTPENKTFIRRSLCNILSDDRLIARVAPYLDWKQFSRENVDLLAKWISGNDVLDSLDKPKQAWIRPALENCEKFLLPSAKFVAGQWLRGHSASPRSSALAVHAYMSLHTPEVEPVLDTAEKIIQAAKWADMEENATWHVMVAAALQGHNRSDTAIEYYQKALEMDPSMWQALAGEAMCYARRATKDDYKEAMRLQTLALELLDKIQPGVATDDSLKQGRHDGLERLGSYHVVLGDTNEAVEAYESALRETNRCSPCVNALLKLYRGKKHHKGIIELLKRMDENIEGLKYTRLSESLITKANYERTNGYFEIIAHAAAVENEIGFLYGIYESAIQVAQKQHKSLEATHLELCLAALYNRHGRPELAAKIWESIATTYHNINTLKSEYALAGVKFDAKISLARHCLKQAVECGKDSKEAQEYGTKLKDLTKVKTDTEITIGGSAVARMLGSWYSFMGQDEKARQCFRGELIEGLRMLADDDPSNDVVAYANLGSILTAAGDYKNAMAMYWKAATIATKMYAEQEQANDTEESNTEISIEKEHLQAKDFCCDACFRRTNGPVAICRYCFDIGFCEQCFTAFKAGNLQVDICSPKHSWGMIHARSKEAREDTEPDKLWLDGEHISIHDWKERLAAEWNI